MKKILLLIILLPAFQNSIRGQAGMWTWMKGDSIANQLGSFGVQGIPSPSNNPPALYEAINWTDLDGNFWLYGGLDPGGARSSDLWKYNVTLNQWVWIKGSGIPNQSPIYGTQGFPSPYNTPGARGYGTPSWVDLSGNLWLFGGASETAPNGRNDLWEYTIATNEWTWIKGPTVINQPGTYGIQGIPSPNNNPGYRWETAATWVDSAGNLWLFGGFANNDQCNDLWEYDIASNEWTWMKGSNSYNQPSAYGIQGVSLPTNTPGARTAYSSFKDSSGNFWLFGGHYFPQASYNDLWQYNVSTNNWTWISGSNIGDNLGNYGPQCNESINYFPSARNENRACWTDECGNFWLFGGYYFVDQVLNDLWKYSPASNNWTLIEGSNLYNQPGTYGNQGIADSSNKPGGRFGSISWLSLNGDLWLFGGWDLSVNSLYNDLWMYKPDTSCGGCKLLLIPASGFIASETLLCEKFCSNFFDQSTNNPTSWQWSFPGGSPSSATDQNPTNICYNNPGTYDITLVTTNAFGSDTLTILNYITVYSTPPFPTITQNGFTLTSSAAAGYQWQYNGIDIAGATSQSYDILQSGYYAVVISDSNGCTSSSTVYIVIEGVEDLSDDPNIFIYPNPSDGDFIVQLTDASAGDVVLIRIMNVTGQVIYSSEELRSIGTSINIKKEIDLRRDASHPVSTGVFFIEIKTSDNLTRKKIVIGK
jgi:hypothetical protein